MSTFTPPAAVVAATKVRAAHVNNLSDATEQAFAALPNEDALRLGTGQFATDAGSVVNAYVVTLPQTPTAYVNGMGVVFAPPLTNTSTATINVNGLGVKSIVLYNGAAVNASDLIQGVPTAIVYSAATGMFHRVGSGPAGTPGATGATGSVGTLANGSVGAPSLAYSTEPTSGSFLKAAGILAQAVQGVLGSYLSSVNGAWGYGAFASRTSGTRNYAFGDAALAALTTGSNNVAMGSNAGSSIISGGDNTAVGYNALLALATTSYNTAIGSGSLGLTTGASNVGVGDSAGLENVTGNQNTYVGAESGPAPGDDNLSNTTAVGYGAVPTASNQVVIGNASVTAIVPGSLGVATLGTALRAFKGLFLDKTITATVGAVTINKPMGSCILASGANSVTVTNNLVTTSSVVLINQTSGINYIAFKVVPAAGSFTITRSSTLADIEYRWVVFN